MMRRLAYLGPAGTYTEQAAMSHDPTATLIPCSSFPAVAAAVESGQADQGVLPIENSLEGSVTFTLDLLIHASGLFVRNELVLPIRHCLMAKPGASAEDIEIIYSHPQALAQCREFLSDRFSRAVLVASLSTSAAVEEMQGSEVVAAAIANERSAALYGAEIMETGIEDNPNNETRFVVLATSDHPFTGTDKTSICFDFDEDAPGILYTVLGEIATRGINLAKIESRPTRQSLGRYIFLVDLEGHREESRVKEALERVRSQVSMFRVFGSYPMHVSSSLE